jgi:DNA-binding transcriptional MocR family regulator
LEIMPKTIRELADELKVSKQTIQYHYQRLPTKNRQKDSQGTNMISLTAERIIRDKVAKPLVANTQQTGSKKVTKTSKENNELIATLRREIEDLKSQRDKQLATKDRQIDHLTKLVDQQQQLQLATVADNRRLKDHVQKLSGQLTQKTNDNLSTGNDLFNIQDKKSKIAKQKIVKSGSNKDGIHTNRAIKRWWKFW